MAFAINCPRCRLAMTATGGDIGTACSCPQCGEKFTVPAPAPRPKVVSAHPLAATAAPTSLPTARPKRKVKIQITAVLAGLFFLVYFGNALLQGIKHESERGFRRYLGFRDSPEERSASDQLRDRVHIQSVYSSDRLINSQYHLRLGNREAIKQYVAELKRADIAQCPADFREARAKVIAAFHSFGEDLGKLDAGGVDSSKSADVLLGAATAVVSSLEQLAQVLRRYDLSIDNDPLWRSSLPR